MECAMTCNLECGEGEELIEEPGKCCYCRAVQCVHGGKYYEVNFLIQLTEVPGIFRNLFLLNLVLIRISPIRNRVFFVHVLFLDASVPLCKIRYVQDKQTFELSSQNILLYYHFTFRPFCFMRLIWFGTLTTAPSVSVTFLESQTVESIVL